MALTSSLPIPTGMLVAACLMPIPANHQKPIPSPSENPVLVIESFRAARAYAVGMDPFTLVGTIRNVGKAPLPAESARARLIGLAGLDVAAEDSQPKLPELAAGASVSYKWQVSPMRSDGPLAASLVVSAPGQAVVVRAYSIPRLESAPAPESPNAAKGPTAVSDARISTLENDRVRARIVNDISRDPVLLFSIRTSGGWRQAGASVPLIEVDSAEVGQRSWWEQLNLEETRASESPADASIHLIGKIGLKWLVELELRVRAGSGVLDADVHLTAVKRVQPLGIRLLPLLAGEGSFGSAATETLDPATGGPTNHRAVRWGEITVGTVRRSDAPLPGWQPGNMPSVEGADYRLLAAEWTSGASFTPLNPGSIVRIRSRIFALAPSASVRDSYGVAPPDTVTQNRTNGR